MSALHGYYLEDLSISQSASLERTITAEDVELFAKVTGDTNPVHLDPEYAATTIFKSPIVHGMFCASLISNLAGTKLPGYGTIYVSQSLKFLAPVYVGESVRAVITVSEIIPEKRRVHFKTDVFVGEKLVLTGEGHAMVDSRKSKES